MPARTLPSSKQRTRLFFMSADPAEIRHYNFGPGDLALIRTKRRSVNRVGFAVQLCLVRYPGFGLEPAEQPSETTRSPSWPISSACHLPTSPIMRKGIKPGVSMSSNSKDTWARGASDWPTGAPVLAILAHSRSLSRWQASDHNRETTNISGG